METVTKEGLEKTNVWFIEPFGRGSIAYYLFSLLSSLVRKDVEATLCTSNDFELKRLVSRFELKEAFPIRFPNGSTGPVVSTLRKATGFIRGLISLRKEAKRKPPEIIHFHSGFVALSDFMLYLFFRSFSSKSKIVYTAHNILPHEKRFYHPFLYRLIYKKTSAVIVHSQKVKREFTRVIRPKCPVVAIPHGNYLIYEKMQKGSGYSLREKLGLAPENKVILFFGAIRRYKGLEVLIRAFRLVVTKLPEARLLIAGKSFGSFEQYEKLISNMRLNNETLLATHYIAAEEVGQYFEASDLVALPYLKVYESGVTQLAYAFGKPVVATKTGGLADTIEEGKSGLLVPPGDHEALAAAIVRVLVDSELAHSLGEYGSRLAESKFSWDMIAEKTVALYRDLLEGKTTNDRE